MLSMITVLLMLPLLCHYLQWSNRRSVSAKFAGPRPQVRNRGGGLANEAFAGPAGLAIICVNYISSYCRDLQLTGRTCNFTMYAGPHACKAFKVFADTGHSVALLVNYGISNTNSLEIP